jgi:excisionase family DNA binding protein
MVMPTSLLQAMRSAAGRAGRAAGTVELTPDATPAGSDGSAVDVNAAAVDRTIQSSGESTRQPSGVMSANELAAFLGVDRKTVYDFAARGVIPHRRLGRRVLFGRQAVLDWLACKSS